MIGKCLEMARVIGEPVLLLQLFQIICADIQTQFFQFLQLLQPAACIQARPVRLGCGNVTGFRVDWKSLFEKKFLFLNHLGYAMQS